MAPAMFVSIFDEGYRVESPCFVSVNDGKISRFLKRSVDVDFEVLQREFVVVNGKEYNVLYDGYGYRCAA